MRKKKNELKKIGEGESQIWKMGPQATLCNFSNEVKENITFCVGKWVPCVRPIESGLPRCNNAWYVLARRC